MYSLCFLSGACALVYEVVWVRELTLILGITSYAVSIVLAAFMAGLALGSYLFGRFALRATRVLRLYGLLELGIGASALLLPLGFAGLKAGYASVYEQLAPHPALFVVVRFALLAGLLAVPCTFMGGTIAVLSKFQSRSPHSLGRDVGLLYALNTLGAVVGCVLAGFVLIEALGLRGTTLLAAAANLGIGLASLGASRLVEPRLQPVTPRPRADSETGEPLAWVGLVVFTISGFCALGYEVLWSRTLAFYLHNSTYAFTAMLASFLLGIGLGSLLFNRWVDRTRFPSLGLALTQAGIAVLSVLAVRLYPSLPVVVDWVQRATALDAWWKALAIQAMQASLILLPPTLLMGLAFPLAVRLYAASPRTVSRDVGVLYAGNTLGSIAGSLSMGFVLLPRLGLIGSFRLLIAINLVAAFLVVLTRPEIPRRRAIAAAGVAALPLLAWGLPPDLFIGAFQRNAVVLFYRDGVADTVMVKADPRNPRRRGLFFSDGRGTAGTYTNRENRIYGHLPLLLHGDAQRVLSIGFGVGNTLAAIATHPEVREIDAVELSPNVLAAAPFFPTNDRVYEDPRVRFHVQDGRNYLLGVDEKYDVIQLEPPEIHTNGVVHLYTREFYDLARERLASGGLICQWANVNMIPIRAQKLLIRAFLEVFPSGTVWAPRQGTDSILLIGGREALRIDYGDFRRGFDVPPVRRDLLRNADVETPVQLLADFKLGAAGARAFAADVPVITDDRTIVDFSAPRSVDANYGLTNSFSGLTVPMVGEGGWPATRDYYVSKLETMRSTIESVFPLLHGFATEGEREAVRDELSARALRFDEEMRGRIEDVKRSRRPILNL